MFDTFVCISNTVVSEPRAVFELDPALQLKLKAAVTRMVQNASKSGSNAWDTHVDAT